MISLLIYEGNIIDSSNIRWVLRSFNVFDLLVLIGDVKSATFLVSSISSYFCCILRHSIVMLMCMWKETLTMNAEVAIDWSNICI